LNDILIAHCDADKSVAGWLGEALSLCGYRVELEPSGRSYSNRLFSWNGNGERVDAAKAVLVLWSNEAQRDLALTKVAERAGSAGKLVAVIVSGAGAVGLPAANRKLRIAPLDDDVGLVETLVGLGLPEPGVGTHGTM
jgi:hypothetical protein